MGVYLFPFTSATKLHFFLGVFLHFITGDDTDKKKNAFDLSRLIRRRMDKLNPSEEYTVYEVDVPDGGHMEEDEDILNYDDLDDPDTFV